MNVQDFLLVASTAYVAGVLTVLIWGAVRSAASKEEHKQLELEARMEAEYQPRHKLGDDETVIVKPRWASTKRWRP